MRKIMCILSAVVALTCEAAGMAPTIYIAGDSTAANKNPSDYPETGWGQVLGALTVEGAKVSNHASGGRSTKSFIDEGRWDKLISSVSTGDVVFIQFGHNDQKADKPALYAPAYGTYSTNLATFVADVRGKGATPVLATSIARRWFDENGKIKQTLGEYPAAMRSLATTMQVDLIDMNEVTTVWLEKLGPEASKAMFVWTEPDEKHPEGRKDNTHLSEKGAKEIARLFVEACAAKKLPCTALFSGMME